MTNKFYNLFFKGGASTQIELHANGLSESYVVGLPPNAPGSTDPILRWNDTNKRLDWAPYPTPDNGSLSSVGLELTPDADALFSVSGSPLTANGNIQLGFDDKGQNLVLASPVSGTGKPIFRKIVDADIEGSISSAKLSGTISPALIPSGTNAGSFQLNAASSGTVLANDPTGLKLLGTDGVTLVDLICRSIRITGDINQENVNQLNVGDSEINLLSGVTTGSPTTNASLNVKRGAQAQAQALWNETAKMWQFGIAGALLDGTRSLAIQITSTNITAGSYTWVHNMGKQPNIMVIDNTNTVISLGVTHQDANTAVIDFSRTGTISGSWTLSARA